MITVEEEGGISAFNGYVVSEPAFAASAELVSPTVTVAPPEALLSGGGVQGGIVIASAMDHTTKKEIN